MTLEDPLRPGIAASVSALTTGVFSDGLGQEAGVDATVALRFALLYVDWNPCTQRWVRPGETIHEAGLVARWEIKKSEIREAIAALSQHVSDVTT
jgi:hypothetical protein